MKNNVRRRFTLWVWAVDKRGKRMSNAEGRPTSLSWARRWAASVDAIWINRQEVSASKAGPTVMFAVRDQFGRLVSLNKTKSGVRI